MPPLHQILIDVVIWLCFLLSCVANRLMEILFSFFKYLFNVCLYITLYVVLLRFMRFGKLNPNLDSVLCPRSTWLRCLPPNITRVHRCSCDYKNLLSFVHFYVRNMRIVFPFQEGAIEKKNAFFLWLTL